MGAPLPGVPTYLIIIYVAVSLSIAVLVVALIYIFCSKRYRLNWFERTLLEEHGQTKSDSIGQAGGAPSDGGVVRILCSSRGRRDSEEGSDSDDAAVESRNITKATVTAALGGKADVVVVKAKPVRQQRQAAFTAGRTAALYASNRAAVTASSSRLSPLSCTYSQSLHISHTRSLESDFDEPSVSIPLEGLTIPVPQTVGWKSQPPKPALDLKLRLKHLAARCMAGVAGRGLLGRAATTTSASTSPSGMRGAEWLHTMRKMGSGPSSPVADASEKFWVPPAVLERKRAQSLVPSLSRQGSDEEAVSSGAATPASIPPLRELSFSFSNERVPGQVTGGDGLPSTPPAGYVPRRRASMHDAIDYTKIDARLYDKKLVRQASVKSIEEENLGCINFTLEHNPETSILTVYVIQARGLVPRDTSGTADPYVRVCLLPHQRSSSAQSKIHRKTVNPAFQEEFIFELTEEQMSSSVLEILVFDYEQFSRDECIGCVRVPIKTLDLSEKVEMCKGILPYEKDKDKDVGDVMFSLSYLPSAERLTVVVVKARNLRHTEGAKEVIDPYCKVTVIQGNKKVKKKKTSTFHNTNNPEWNEALVFNLPKEYLSAIALEISVFHDNKLGNDECLGKVRLSRDSSGEDKAHWKDLIREQMAVARWHKLS